MFCGRGEGEGGRALGSEGLLGGLTSMITFFKTIQEKEFEKHLGHSPFFFSLSIKCVS